MARQATSGLSPKRYESAPEELQIRRTLSGRPPQHHAATAPSLTTGPRLSDRGAHDILRTIAEEAAITADFTGGHVLRHTFGTRLVREGHDILLVAELMGHAGLETTRAYSLPTDADREAAINSLLTVLYRGRLRGSELGCE